jgi:hypothetical protein
VLVAEEYPILSEKAVNALMLDMKQDFLLLMLRQECSYQLLYGNNF